MRRETEEASRRLHGFIAAGKTPAPVYTAKCDACSLSGVCMPRRLEEGASVADYLRTAVEEV